MVVRQVGRTWPRAWLLVIVVCTVLASLLPTIARAASPAFIRVNGAALAGASTGSPFTAEIANGEGFATVKFLLDNAFLGEDKTAPFTWTVTASNGAHNLKARAEDAAGTRTNLEASFTVGPAPVPSPTASASPAGSPSPTGSPSPSPTVSPSSSTSPSPGGSATPAPSSTAGPRLVSGGQVLDTGQVSSPFTVDVVDAGAVDSGGVSFLLDNTYLGKDTTAPYQYTVKTTIGTHELKARWDTAATGRQTLTASFRVVARPVWATPKTVYEQPGPALKSLWVTADNRRAKIDGLYDWSKAGFGGGTVLPTDDNVRGEDACKITADELKTDFDVVPNDGKDDTFGLQNAVDQVKAQCSPTGGYTAMSRISLPAGTLNIDHELSLDADYLILRGAGSGTGGTKLVYAPNADTRYDTISDDGTRWDQDAMTAGDANGGWLWPGRGLFRVQSRAVADKYATQYAAAPENRKDLFEGTVNDHWISGLKLRGKPGDANYAARKGDTVVYLATTAAFDNLKVGGLVNVMAANSQKFYDEMQATPTEYELLNLHMRQQMFMVTAGDPLAKTITLDKPLEYDVPVNSVSDGSAAIGGKVFDSKVSPLVDAVVGVGIENLSFTQSMPNLDKAAAKSNYGNMDPSAAMHGIVFKWAANSWVKGVRTEMTGSHPIVTEVAANLSIVDNHLDGSWNKGKGGNGYLRGSRVWDSVYSGNTTRNLRHFTFQWSASGNVAIGNSFDSDLNLHGGYERNNLFELNEVSVPYAHRSANCDTNCGDEGNSAPDDSDWYPIWWAAGKKAVKWSGSSGPNNVFFNNHLRKQLGGDTTPYTDYTQYNQQSRVYQLGSDSNGGFKHLQQAGTAIPDWAHNETKDFTNGNGVAASRSHAGRSLFLKSVSLSGYGGPHPQPLRRTWGCSCWDGNGMVNTRLAADPVNTATGSLMESFTDTSIAGIGRTLDWGRTYNSLDATDGPFGPGWTFSFNASMRREADGSYTFRDPTGSQTRYTKTGSTYTTADPGVTATLSDRGEGGWLLRNITGDELVFDADGKLIVDRDAQGRGVTATYDGYLLTTLTDALGQTLTITWGTTGPADGRIVKVTGSDTRTVSYGYTTTSNGPRLTAVTLPDGTTATYTYDAGTGYLNGITDPLGHTLSRNIYDQVTGRVIKQTDAAGGVWHFSWDQATETATTTDPAGKVTKDVYQGNVLVSQIDGEGRATDLYYNANNQVIALNSPGQELVRNEYDARGNLNKRTTPASVDDLNPAVETWTYDNGNRVTQHTDVFGSTTSYDYDTDGQLTKTTYADGSTTSSTYTGLGQVATSTDQLGRTIRFTYGTTGDLIKKVTPGGAVTTYTYDSAHHRLSETSALGNVDGADAATKEKYTSHFTYDVQGNVLTQTDPLDRTTTHAYDANGQLTTVTAPDGGITRYTYDANGNTLTVTDAAGRVTSYVYDQAGMQTAVVAPDGAKTTYAYDAKGQRVSQTSPAGNVGGAAAETTRRNTTSYVYDAAGRRTQTRVVDPAHPDTYLVTTTTYDAQGRAVAATSPTLAVTRTEYDKAGRIVTTVDPTGVATAITYDALGRQKTTTSAGITVTNTYDAAGQLIKAESGSGATTLYTYDVDGQQTSITDPRGKVTAFAYDEAGQRTQVTDPLGNTTRAIYDSAGQTVEAVDAEGHSLSYAHDQAGRVTTVTAATGAITTYTYDIIGQLASVTNPAGKSYTYAYDTGGRVTQTTSPGGRTSRYAYTVDGRPSTVTRPEGSIQYTYDNLGQTTTVDYSDNSPDISYTYNGNGRPETVTNGTTTARYTYDIAGRVTTLARGTQSVSYDYDDHGRLTSRTLPDGRVQAYTWDVDSRLETATLTTGGTSRTVTFGYDDAGALTTITRADGPVTTRAYDDAGQLTALDTKNPAGTTLVGQTIERDRTGAPTTVTTTRDGHTSASLYTYDAAGQIISVCLPDSGTTCTSTAPTNTYTYDAAGNRTSSTTLDGQTAETTTYTHDDDDRVTLSNTGGVTTTYTYDPNGALTGTTGPDGHRAYDYGLDGNLYTAVLETGKQVAYAYDESGNRTRRIIDGTDTATWSWDTGLGTPVRVDEKNGTGTVTHQWWADPTSDLGTGLADTAGSTPAWLIGDYQGSITDLADNTTLTGSAVLDTFGEATTASGAYTTNYLRWHGQYLDEATGLYDIRARDYDPSLGRFTSTDPAGANPGTPFLSTYNYGANRPTVLTDPSGACPWCIIGGALIGAAIGGIDCAADFSGWGNCAKKVGLGAAAGALVGAGLGYLATAGLSVGATLVIGGAIEAAGVVAYGYTSANTTGGSYGWSDAAWDAGATFVGTAAGALLGKGLSAAGRATGVSSKLSEAATWLKNNTFKGRPKNVDEVACPPDAPSRSANQPKTDETTNSVSSQVKPQLEQLEIAAARHGLTVAQMGKGVVWANKLENYNLMTPKQLAAVKNKFSREDIQAAFNYYDAVRKASATNPSAHPRAELMSFYLENWGR